MAIRINGDSLISVLCGLFLCVTLLQLGCTPTKSVREAKQELDEYLKRCTAQHGYAPDSTDGLDEYRLAPTERAYNDCAYAGINNLIIPSTTIPKVYKALIDEHVKMTEAIEREEMTRSERQARIELLLGEIREQEKVEEERRLLELERMMHDMQEQRRRVEAESIIRHMGVGSMQRAFR